MATSNRDRVGRGFEVLAEGLEPFVDEVMTAASPSGGDWIKLMEARDSTKFGTSRTYDKSDPQVQLRVITEEWRAGFKDRLSRGEQSIASLLRDLRNKWAHNTPFSSDDTSHVLDLMERLLTAAGDVDRATVIRKLRQDHQRTQYEAETRRAAKETQAFSGVPGQGLKPWREVIQPHPDVASGGYDAAEFAADLDGVSRNEGTQEYVDPVSFFQRTYLTEGLKDLLTRASARLSGDTNASPVINLQTNFGGGKTHSMLALYHLASGRPLHDYPQDVQDLLAGSALPPAGSVKRVTLVGNRISATTGVEHHDEQGTVQVKTLWGELAWQLGGRAAYEMIARDDDNGTNPGNALIELVREYSPCLILIDEWVAYARELYGKDFLDAGSFGTQFGFAQTLTEGVKAAPGALLVISIPASEKLIGQDITDDTTEDAAISDLEVGGVHGREALKKLQQVVGRLAKAWQPATADESFEIVRRRLFQETDAAGKADIAAIARAFVQYYRANSGEFPRDCSEPAYEDRIKSAYPIHPELFDRLYKDWSALPRFQRTRGVLRLMSTVVHALWASGDRGPLIMPASIPLDVASVVGEITQYLDDEWKPIVHTDVDGDSSTPVQIDAGRSTFGARSVTRRLARTVFFGSAATLRTAHKGIERPDLWLGTALPGDTVGNFGSAIDLLAQRATYFYPEAGRYWYDTAQSVTRKAQDYAERLRDERETVWEEIRRRLRDQMKDKGDFAAVHPGPESTSDVPDHEEARLVLLHPQFAHGRGETDSTALQFAARCLKERGSSQRINVNQLVFLAADKARLEELEDAVRFHLAWKDVAARSGPDDLNLTGQQKKQAETQRNEFHETVNLRISQTYKWAMIPEQPDPQRPYKLTSLKAEGAEDRLALRVTKILNREGALTARYGARNVRMDLDGPLHSVWDRGHITLGELWGYYRRYPYLSRLRDRSALEHAALSVLDEIVWDADGFALATGFDDSTGTYTGLALPPHDTFAVPTDATLLVAPGLAIAQRDREIQDAAERQAAAQTVQQTDAEGTHPDPGTPIPWTDSPAPSGPATLPTPTPMTRNTRFFGVYPVDPERAGRDFGKIAQEILPHLQTPEGAQLRITVEIEAVNGEGYPDDKVRVVTENARTLKFEQYGFEDD